MKLRQGLSVGWLLVATMFVGGCGAQSVLLGTTSEHLFVTMDAVAVPGEEIAVRARLQGGDFLRAKSGYVVRFYKADELFAAAETDGDGMATVTFQPTAVGDFPIRAELAAAGFEGNRPEPQELLVICRAADTPIVVVDMDRTVVADGFHAVLVGNPDPMAKSADVLAQLAKTHTIIYLTHRPDAFSAKSKQWLIDHGYPTGPVLLSTTRGFLSGSGKFKTGVLQELGQRFSRIEIGIGDKITDAAAYHANGLRAYVMLPTLVSPNPEPYELLAAELAELDSEIRVVTTWEQVRQGLFEGASFPPDEMAASLTVKAAQLRAAPEQP
jgi:hypothetical protein